MCGTTWGGHAVSSLQTIVLLSNRLEPRSQRLAMLFKVEVDHGLLTGSARQDFQDGIPGHWQSFLISATASKVP